MSFIAPLMLWGVGAASVPIILHLFYRSRYRTVPWAAMKFLLTSIEQTSRRLRLQELLLLLVRTALLGLLGLALARPTTQASRGSAAGDAVDAILLIDTSYSMGARDGAKTRLERAKESALAVLDHLPSHSTVQIIQTADRAMPLGPAAASDLDQARELLRSILLSHLSTDYLPGLEEASRALARGRSPNKELYLFSDLQKSGWDAQSSAVQAKLREIGKTCAVTLVRCGTRMPRNVSIVAVQPQSGIPHTGERVAFSVLVRNSGTESVRDLTVTLDVEGRAKERESQAIPSLAPGETQAVTVTAKLEEAGFRTVKASVGPDELDADNVFLRVVHVREQTHVLVVDGSPSVDKPETSASFYLMHTLRPVPESAWVTYHVQPKLVTPAEALPELLADADACILANVPLAPSGETSPSALSQEFVDRLRRFVHEGHGLLMFAGPRVSVDLYNRAFFEEHALLPFKLLAAETAPPAGPLHPDPGSADASSFLSVFREEPLSRLSQTNVTSWIGVEEHAAKDCHVPLRYGNGKPAVVCRLVDGGEVIFVTTSVDALWTDWPLRHTYLPFVHVALSHLLDSPTAAHNVVAGEPLKWRPPAADGDKMFFARDPDGKRLRLGVPSMIEGQPLVTVEETPRAGAYRIL
ncbi:MAG TPA: BatA domain-containing protein, partial [Planctomycetota bacterium]|nr:BatA domain-containing protein [Planctomycetota bacterium]